MPRGKAAEEKAYNAKGQELCNSPLRNKSGERCKSPIIMENGRCVIHGGNTPKGELSPQYQGKGFSAYIPKGSRDEYLASLESPELVDLRRYIALIENRIKQLLKSQVQGEGSTADWEGLLNCIADYQCAQANGDTKKQSAAMEGIIVIAEQQGSGIAAWKEIAELSDLVRKQVQSQTKVELNKQNAISLQRATLLVDSVGQAIREAVEIEIPGETEEDADLRRRILTRTATGLRRILVNPVNGRDSQQRV